MKKYRVLLTIISLCLTVTMITGVSYAFYTFRNNQTDNNLANSDCFKLSFEDNNDITIQNAVPINESTAIQLTPYHFTIKNICNHTSSYLITLEKLNDSSLDDKFVRVRLNDYPSTLLSELHDFNEYILNENAINSKGLYSEYLLPNEEKTFNLWMWIDENSTIEAAGKEYISKIVVTGYLIKDPYINISFNAGNGTVNPSMKQSLVNRNIGELPIPTKDGSVFIGWYTSDGKLVNENTIFDEDTELYARWKSEPINLKLYLRSLTQDNTSVVQDDLSGDANMRYVGSDPNNYVLFGCQDEANPTIETCEKWRIVGVFNSNSYSDSNELVRIVKAEAIPNVYGDDRQTSGNNYFQDSQMQQLINSSTYPYATSVLAKNITWKTGAIDSNAAYGEGGTLVFYTAERGTEKSKAYYYKITYTGVVGAAYASDYLFATSGDGTIESRTACLNTYPVKLSSGTNTNWRTSTETDRGVCAKNSWLIEYSSNSNNSMWTMSSVKSSQMAFYTITPSSSLGSLSSATARNYKSIQPSVYLNQDVICRNCGDATAGTSQNPYIIVNGENLG